MLIVTGVPASSYFRLHSVGRQFAEHLRDAVRIGIRLGHRSLNMNIEGAVGCPELRALFGNADECNTWGW